MKYSILSRIKYLSKAQHRGGHGIHSPFLFHLITTVIENKQQNAEYKIINKLHTNSLNLLNQRQDLPFNQNSGEAINITDHPRKLSKKLELPRRFHEMIFRLIREFKPAAIIHYGPTIGINSGVMALANPLTPVYQITEDHIYDLLAQDLLMDPGLTNLCFLPQDSVPPVRPEFVMINYPENPERNKILLQRCIHENGENDLIIIKGIHHSKEMEEIWKEMTLHTSVRVTLDLFETGIVLFRRGLQKENFILRF